MRIFMQKQELRQGINDSVPIILGYLPLISLRGAGKRGWHVDHSGYGNVVPVFYRSRAIYVIGVMQGEGRYSP